MIGEGWLAERQALDVSNVAQHAGFQHAVITMRGESNTCRSSQIESVLLQTANTLKLTRRESS